MDVSANLPTARDKLLFTPGPLTTSLSVKQAMLRDAGSWHFEFNAKVKWVREKILQLAGLSREAGWEAILLQGSGTFGVESVFATCVPLDGKVVVLANGAYGERMVLMLQRLKIAHLALRTPENIPNDPLALERALAADKTITHVALVHCETTTGILNPINETGFRLYLDPSVQSFIIASFHFPNHPGFTFDEFYRRLSEKGFIIYPGKISQADTFRIGSIGRIFPSDIEALLAAIRIVLQEMEIL